MTTFEAYPNRLPPPRREDDGDDRPSHWVIDKKIPVALILSILMSVGSGIWYASATNARLLMIEEKVQEQSTLRDDIILLKEQVRTAQRLLERIEQLLDRRDMRDGQNGGKGNLEKTGRMEPQQ